METEKNTKNKCSNNNLIYFKQDDEEEIINLIENQVENNLIKRERKQKINGKGKLQQETNEMSSPCNKLLNSSSNFNLKKEYNLNNFNSRLEDKEEKDEKEEKEEAYLVQENLPHLTFAENSPPTTEYYNSNMISLIKEEEDNGNSYLISSGNFNFNFHSSNFYSENANNTKNINNNKTFIEKKLEKIISPKKDFTTDVIYNSFNSFINKVKQEKLEVKEISKLIPVNNMYNNNSLLNFFNNQNSQINNNSKEKEKYYSSPTNINYKEKEGKRKRNYCLKRLKKLNKMEKELKKLRKENKEIKQLLKSKEENKENKLNITKEAEVNIGVIHLNTSKLNIKEEKTKTQMLNNPFSSTSSSISTTNSNSFNSKYSAIQKKIDSLVFNKQKIKEETSENLRLYNLEKQINK